MPIFKILYVVMIMVVVTPVLLIAMVKVMSVLMNKLNERSEKLFEKKSFTMPYRGMVKRFKILKVLIEINVAFIVFLAVYNFSIIVMAPVFNAMIKVRIPPKPLGYTLIAASIGYAILCAWLAVRLVHRHLNFSDMLEEESQDNNQDDRRVGPFL